MAGLPSDEQMHNAEMTTPLLLMAFRDSMVSVGIEAAADACGEGSPTPFSTNRVPGSADRSWVVGVLLTMSVTPVACP